MAEHYSYFNGNAVVTEEIFTQLACNPNASVCVEACAGSGKTWLLVARILRLLLEGVSSNEILAITFTRKAATEMQERLLDLLRHLEVDSEELVIAALTMRGLSKNEATLLLPKARKLYQKTLSDPVVINTFHGWFAILLQGAPLSSGIMQDLELNENAENLREKAWDPFWHHLNKSGTIIYRAAYEQLLDELGTTNTHDLLNKFFDYRAEWWSLKLTSNENWVTECSNLDFSNEAKLSLINSKENLLIMASHLANGSQAECDKANKYIDIGCRLDTLSILELPNILKDAWELFFVAKATIAEPIQRAFKPTKKLLTFLTQEKIDILLNAHALFCQNIIDAKKYLEDAYSIQLNKALFLLGDKLLECYCDFKRDNRIIDFTDLEILSAQLLMQNCSNAAYLQIKLDASYKHILLDEFQDTNPIQWQILSAWLGSYQHLSLPLPKIFLVGDPKQAIYRFRRADVRLFEVAKNYLINKFNAHSLCTAKSRRNSKAVTIWVNKVFLPKTGKTTCCQIPDYLEQSTAVLENGATYLLPLIARSNAIETNKVSDNQKWRNSFSPFSFEEANSHYFNEGIQAADWIKFCKKNHPESKLSDFLLLIRHRRHLHDYEAALRQSGISYISPRIGGLLNTLEGQDIIALLSFLINQQDNFSLVQILKSPLFNLSEVQLLELKNLSPNTISWWEKRLASRFNNLNLQEIFDKLNTWINWAKNCSAHDLLDAIYVNSHAKQLYAAAAPPQLASQVQANLDALLHLSLKLADKKYLSPVKFLHILLDMQENKNATTNEGIVLDETINKNRNKDAIRILTIHAAKGLEAPFVLLLDANCALRNLDSCGILINWPPNAATPTHFSAWGKNWKGIKRNDLFAEEELIIKRENTNLLYVAMTRAQKVFAVSAIAGIDASDSINIDSWYSALAKDMQVFSMNKINEIKITSEPILNALTMQASNLSQYRCFHPAFILEALPIDLNSREFSIKQDIGKILHFILEQINRYGLHNDINIKAYLNYKNAENLAKLLQTQVDTCKAALKIAQNIIYSPSIKKFFDPTQYINAWNEVELLAADGRLLRIDRLVEFKQELVILDYKSNPNLKTESDISDDLRNQLINYASALALIRVGKAIKTTIITLDGSFINI